MIFKRILFKLFIALSAQSAIGAEPVGLDLTRQDMRCLVENIFYEAGNQSNTGKMAVAYVTINRWLSDSYPNSVCEVVYQKANGVCQFSWVCKKRYHPSKQGWRDAWAVALDLVSGYNHRLEDPTLGAQFYHATYVKPYWRKKLHRTVRIEDHIFYRHKDDS